MIEQSTTFEKIKEMKPIFKEKFVTYHRKEKDHYLLVYSANAYGAHEIYLNYTMQKILSLCDGETSVERIANCIWALFKNEPNFSDIARDVVSALRELSLYKLIEWEGKNPFMKQLEFEVEGKSIYLAEEQDLRELVSFIRKSYSNDDYIKVLNPIMDKDYYVEEPFIREKLFKFSEDFYLLKSNEDIIGVISLTLPKSIKTSSVINLLIAKNKEDIPLLIKTVINNAKNYSSQRISKIKYQTVTNNQKIIDQLKSIGFFEEGILRKEIDDTDISVYGFYME